MAYEKVGVDHLAKCHRPGIMVFSVLQQIAKLLVAIADLQGYPVCREYLGSGWEYTQHNFN